MANEIDEKELRQKRLQKDLDMSFWNLKYQVKNGHWLVYLLAVRKKSK